MSASASVEKRRSALARALEMTGDGDPGPRHLLEVEVLTRKANFETWRVRQIIDSGSADRHTRATGWFGDIGNSTPCLAFPHYKGTRVRSPVIGGTNLNVDISGNERHLSYDFKLFTVCCLVLKQNLFFSKINE